MCFIITELHSFVVMYSVNLNSESSCMYALSQLALGILEKGMFLQLFLSGVQIFSFNYFHNFLICFGGPKVFIWCVCVCYKELAFFLLSVNLSQ